MLTNLWAFQTVGGGEQVLLTCQEELERRGHDVVLFNQWSDRLASFDVLHYFHCGGWDCWPRLRALGPPLVVTPTLWCEAPRWPWLVREVRHAAHRLIDSSWCPPLDERDVRHHLRIPNLLLPASGEEANRLRAHAGVPASRISVVPNAVRLEGEAAALPNPIADLLAEPRTVLCVGTFHHTKNQLGLIHALQGTQLRVVFIGDPAIDDDDSYLMRCRLAARDKHAFCPAQPHAVVLAAMRLASVYVQPSFRETCGLAALEAAALGCRVVITERGATREYFDRFAWYCDPDSPVSIRSAVLSAMASQPDPALSGHVVKEFSVERLGARLETAYRGVVVAP